MKNRRREHEELGMRITNIITHHHHHTHTHTHTHALQGGLRFMIVLFVRSDIHGNHDSDSGISLTISARP